MSKCSKVGFIEEDSQYTVSQILKFFEEDENENNLPKFCNNDNDVDEDNDVKRNTQTIECFTDEDDTVNYDFVGSKYSETVSKSEASVRSNELSSRYIVSSVNDNKAIIHVSKNAVHNNDEKNYNRQNQNKHNQKVHGHNAHTTPKTENMSNVITYHCRSPSVLINSPRVLSNKFGNHQIDRLTSDFRKKSSNDKPPPNKKQNVMDILSLSIKDLNENKGSFSIGNSNHNHNQIQPSAENSTSCIWKMNDFDATNSHCNTEYSVVIFGFFIDLP